MIWFFFACQPITISKLHWSELRYGSISEWGVRSWFQNCYFKGKNRHLILRHPHITKPGLPKNCGSESPCPHSQWDVSSWWCIGLLPLRCLARQDVCSIVFLGGQVHIWHPYASSHKPHHLYVEGLLVGPKHFPNCSWQQVWSPGTCAGHFQVVSTQQIVWLFLE